MGCCIAVFGGGPVAVGGVDAAGGVCATGGWLGGDSLGVGWVGCGVAASVGRSS